MTQRKPITETITLPQGFSAALVDRAIVLKGKGAELKRDLAGVVCKLSGSDIILTAPKGSKKEKKMLMSIKAHIKNMVQGLNDKHVYRLKICSGHFPMTVAVQKGEFVVKNFYGEKVPRTLKIHAGADVKVEGDIIVVTGHDREIAGQVAAGIQQLTRRTGFDRRIFQDGIYIIEKSGKAI